MADDADRIVILNDFSAIRGGAAYLALLLAEHLAAAGQTITFICGDSGQTAVPAGVDLVALGGQQLLGDRSAALTGLYNRAACRAVMEWIRRHDTPRTIYHLHNWSQIFSPAIFHALAPVAERCVIHTHDFFLACPNGAYFEYRQKNVCWRTPLSASCIATQCDKRTYSHKLWRIARQGILLRRLAPFLDASHFVMIYAPMREWLARAITPAQIGTISNPASPFGDIVTAPERNRRLIYIGQMQRFKGVFDIAEAGRRLGARIDFLGEGDDRSELEQTYPEHAYHGWQTRAAIADHLREARATMVATQSPEPFCLAAFETLATGLPLIVSDSILAAPDLAASGAALTYAAADADALTSQMQRIIADDALVADLARAARERGPSLSQSVENWVTAHRILYSSILRRGEAPSPHPDAPDRSAVIPQ